MKTATLSNMIRTIEDKGVGGEIEDRDQGEGWYDYGFPTSHGRVLRYRNRGRQRRVGRPGIGVPTAQLLARAAVSNEQDPLGHTRQRWEPQTVAENTLQAWVRPSPVQVAIPHLSAKLQSAMAGARTSGVLRSNQETASGINPLRPLREISNRTQCAALSARCPRTCPLWWGR